MLFQKLTEAILDFNIFIGDVVMNYPNTLTAHPETVHQLLNEIDKTFASKVIPHEHPIKVNITGEEITVYRSIDVKEGELILSVQSLEK